LPGTLVSLIELDSGVGTAPQTPGPVPPLRGENLDSSSDRRCHLRSCGGAWGCELGTEWRTDLIFWKWRVL